MARYMYQTFFTTGMKLEGLINDYGQGGWRVHTVRMTKPPEVNSVGAFFILFEKELPS